MVYGYEFDKDKNLTKIKVSIDQDLSVKEKNKVYLRTNPGLMYQQSYVPGSFYIYAKQDSITLDVVNTSLGKIKNTADRTFLFIWIVIIASIIAAFLNKKGLSGFIFLIKYFQILDIISNFSKINIFYSMSVRMTLDFIEILSFPTIPFIENLSVIKDGEKR